MTTNSQKPSVHLVGIGGMGVSALAKYYLSSGIKVSGSDLKSSEITEELEKSGTKIFVGNHTKTNLPKDVNKIIYTSAVTKENPELKEAKRRGLGVRSYPEEIGELTKKYETITVSGAHGKSTTTALSALVLVEGYFDPTVIVGTKVKEFGDSNFRRGYGSHLVLEADEWNKSFLNYAPTIAIVTNIDSEHLDTYKNIADVKKIFGEYLSKVPRDGKIIANADDKFSKSVAKRFGKKVLWYSTSDKEVNTIKRVIKIPGEHNVSNALAATKLGRLLGVREPDIIRVIAGFNGAWRRFEFKGILESGAYLFSDYGHHPTEIYKTIVAARNRFPFRRIWCVYQPHQYRRLEYLWKEFTTAFDMADRICLLPVYDVAGRENKEFNPKNSMKLTDELTRRGKNACYLNSFQDAEKLFNTESKKGDVVLAMGAGDIHSNLVDLDRLDYNN